LHSHSKNKTLNQGISIIIPTYNEATTINVLLDRIFSQKSKQMEVIVVDADTSSDNIESLLSHYEIKFIKAHDTCRSVQLNLGAQEAKYDILYFAHADVVVTSDFHQEIISSINDGNSFGFFRYQFDSSKWLLKINSYFSQFKSFFTGGGDQTFFILKKVFNENNGFDEDLHLCEDFALFDKLKKTYPYEIIDSKVLVSDRKYEKASYFKINLVNLYILLKFRKGQDTLELKNTYKRLLS